MTNVTFIGAGSAVFARQIMTDILAVEGLDAGEFRLVDIDERRLDLARRMAEKLVEISGKSWNVAASTDRRQLLEGSDFVVNTVEVAGLANVEHDYEIPLRYGVDQCIGDTIGPGGIFKALRTGPVWLEILRDCERLCPRAWVLNYTNPMSILTFVALTATSMRTVGLCHSVQSTSRLLATYLDVPYDELRWRCAGINHNSWFVEARRSRSDPAPPRTRSRSRDLRAGPGPFRDAAPLRRLPDREQRPFLRVRPVLPEATRSGRALHSLRLPRRERVLRPQLA